MFQTTVSRSRFGSAVDIAELIYHNAVRTVRKGNVPNDVEKRFRRRCGFDGYAA